MTNEDATAKAKEILGSDGTATFDAQPGCRGWFNYHIAHAATGAVYSGTSWEIALELAALKMAAITPTDL